MIARLRVAQQRGIELRTNAMVVAQGAEITITRHGRAVAVLVRPDALRGRRADAALEDAGRIHELLTQAAAEPLPEGPGLTAQRAEELIAGIRAGRDAR